MAGAEEMIGSLLEKILIELNQQSSQIHDLIKSVEIITNKVSLMGLNVERLGNDVYVLSAKVDGGFAEMKIDSRQVRRRLYGMETDLDETINRVDNLEKR